MQRLLPISRAKRLLAPKAPEGASVEHLPREQVGKLYDLRGCNSKSHTRRCLRTSLSTPSSGISVVRQSFSPKISARTITRKRPSDSPASASAAFLTRTTHASAGQLEAGASAGGGTACSEATSFRYLTRPMVSVHVGNNGQVCRWVISTCLLPPSRCAGRRARTS